MWRRWQRRRREFDTHTNAYTDANPHTDADALSDAYSDTDPNSRVDANAGDPPPASCEPHTPGSE